ncbi:MAG TPA: TIGR03936 family radical SAM-associated protein [Isosphaeraceae bacterium]|jgi:radical SAM-linked protein
MTAVPKVRLRFAKRGDLRLVSHHDLVRCVERALRRAAIPVATTQGFNPRPKVTFALALALGIEGRREVVEIDLAAPLEPAEVLERLAATSPPGLEWLGAEPATSNRAAQAQAACYRLDLPEPRRAAASAAVAELLSSPSRPYSRKRPDRTVELDLRPFLLDAAIDPEEGALGFRLKVTNSGASARPEDIVDVLGLSDLLRDGSVLARLDIELAPERPGPDRPASPDAAGAADPPTTTTAPASERPTA